MVQHCEASEYIGSVSISAHKINSPDAPNVSNRLTFFEVQAKFPVKMYFSVGKHM